MNRSNLLMEYRVLRMEYLKRVLMRIQIEQDGETNLVPDEDLDLSNVNWQKFAFLWESYVPQYRK